MMHTEYDLPRKRPLRWLLVVIILILLLTVGSFVGYKYARSLGYFSFMQSFTQWASLHQQQAQIKLTQVKAAAFPSVEAQPPIEFEFYKTLADAQPLERDLDDVKDNPLLTNQPPLVLATNETVSAKNKSEVKPVAAMAHAVPKKHPVVTAKEIEFSLAQELKKEWFVIQLGVYQHQLAAKNYQTQLKKMGIKSRLTKKTTAGKPIFRLETGPYEKKTQARVARQRLQKQGIQGIVRATDNFNF